MIDLMTLRASTNASATQHRDVGDRERDQHDFGQEVRRQRRGAIGEPDDAAEHGEQDDDAREDQRRVVAERPPRRRGAGGLAAGRDAELRGLAVATRRLLLVALQRAHFVREVVDVAEVAIDRRKAHVGDLIELLQLRHHQRAELACRRSRAPADRSAAARRDRRCRRCPTA